MENEYMIAPSNEKGKKRYLFFAWLGGIELFATKRGQKSFKDML